MAPAVSEQGVLWNLPADRQVGKAHFARLRRAKVWHPALPRGGLARTRYSSYSLAFRALVRAVVFAVCCSIRRSTSLTALSLSKGNPQSEIRNAFPRSALALSPASVILTLWEHFDDAVVCGLHIPASSAEGKVAVLGGALAVPCTCNPLQQGRIPLRGPRCSRGSGPPSVEGRIPCDGSPTNWVRAGRQQP